MSFVSFLKQFGLDVLKGVQIFEGIAPVATTVIGALNPKLGTELDTITQMASEALSIEGDFASAFGPTNPTGAAKLAALIPNIQQIVLASQAMTGKQVAQPALFSKSMQEYAQATVDLLNSLKPSVSSGNPAQAPSVPSANLPLPPLVPAVKTP
jgi:hypothetical protein